MLVLLKHNGMKMFFFFSGHLFMHPVKMVSKLKGFFWTKWLS